MNFVGAPFRLMSRQPWIIAVLISLAIVAWMASGVAATGTADSDTEDAATAKVVPLPKVMVADFIAQPVDREITLYGRTEPDRKVSIRTEVAGKVEAVLVKRGSLVKAGQQLVRLAKNDRPQQLAQAEALLKQRELEYQGAKQLKSKGYQAETQLAASEAQLKDAKARVARLKLDIDNTVIRAPFAGILNERMVELGDYIKDGDPVAEIIDANPLVVRADVTESDVSSLTVYQDATVRFADGEKVTGQLRYISRVADPATNTFRIEVAIDNPDGDRLAGMSAEVVMAVDTAQAIKVSPALLALDEEGNLGLKRVVDGMVDFVPAELIKSEPDGIWLGGVDSKTTLITIGAGFVRPGDAVEAVYAKEPGQ